MSGSSTLESKPNEKTNGPNPSGLCMCGCGEKTALAYKDDARYGIKKGTPQRYIFGHTQRSKRPEYIVDSETGCWEWQRAKNRTGYGIRQEGLAHRIAYMRINGQLPSHIYVDHICRNPGCVNPEHLRAATPAQNSQNRSLQGNRESTSRFRGVYYDARLPRPWMTQVVIEGRRHSLGSFATEDEAGEVVRKFRAERVPFSACDQKFAIIGYEARKERNEQREST